MFYDGLLHVFRLQYHQSAVAFPSCSSRHLRHHGEGVFVCPEVGHVEHGVGIQYSHHTYVVEIESLAHHLRSDENLRTPGREVIYYPLVCVAGTGSVEVHPGNGHVGEQFHYLLLNLLRSIPIGPQVLPLAVRTFLRHAVGETAVVTCQHVHVLVEGEGDIAVFAFRHPSAGAAFHHRCKAAPVLEQYHLLPVIQCLFHRLEQQR